MIHTVKAFGIVNEAEVGDFSELSWFFDDPVDIGNLISGSSAFSKASLNISKFTVHVLLKPGNNGSVSNTVPAHFVAFITNNSEMIIIYRNESYY